MISGVPGKEKNRIRLIRGERQPIGSRSVLPVVKGKGIILTSYGQQACSIDQTLVAL